VVELIQTEKIKSYEKGPIRRSLFSNGAVTLFHQFRGLQSATVNLYFLVGSMHERPQEYGITHVIEHMLFKEGGKSQIVKELEFEGAEINAYTYKEYVCFELDCLASKLDLFIPKFLKLFLNPVFDKNELKLEKQVVVQELKEDLDDHETVGYEYIMKKNFDPDLGHSIGGTISNVKRFTQEDLFAFYYKYFTADRMILSVASGLPCSKLEKYLQNAMTEKRFHKKRKAKRLGYCSRFSDLEHFRSTIRRKMESPILFYSLNSVSLESQYYYDLVILDELLFEGLSSKFFVELREKSGLLYGMGSSINSFVKTGNYMMVFNGALKNMDLVKKKVKSILQYYAENEFDAEEVEAIKRRVNDSWQTHFDDLSARNEYMASIEIYQTGKFSITHQEKLVERVTPKRLKWLVNKMLKLGMTELLMLPKK
jgi:predicted Zn-dependent peptidase